MRARKSSAGVGQRYRGVAGTNSATAVSRSSIASLRDAVDCGMFSSRRPGKLPLGRTGEQPQPEQAVNHSEGG